MRKLLFGLAVSGVLIGDVHSISGIVLTNTSGTASPAIDANTNSGNNSVIVGGTKNNISKTGSFIGGGLSNEITQNNLATVGGGEENKALGARSFVGGGHKNKAGGSETVVAGGSQNEAGGSYSFIGGGKNSVTSGDSVTVCGGDNNDLAGAYGTIGGGRNNSVTGGVQYTSILGGFNNTITKGYSSILGGYKLKISGIGSIGFNSFGVDTNEYEITEDNVASFYNVKMGVHQLSPKARLDVNGGLRLGEATEAVATDAGILQYKSGELQLSDGSGNWDPIAFASGSSTYWAQSGTDIYYTGDVGIGTTSPSSKLTVNGAIDFDSTKNGIFNTAHSMRINIDSDNGATGESFIIGHNQTTIDQNNALFKVQDNGNVGIGTTNPLVKLSVKGDAIRLNRTGSDYGGAIEFQRNSVSKWFVKGGSVGTADDFALMNGSSTTVMQVLQAGDIGIGTPATGDKLTVGGNTKVIGNITITGTVTANGSLVHSDKRFKKDIKPISNALSKLVKVEGKSYNFKQDIKGRAFSKNPQIGVIAQDLQRVFPELVNKDKDGYLSVNYNSLIPVVIEGVKEQQIEIRELKDSKKKMEAALVKLQKQINFLLQNRK